VKAVELAAHARQVLPVVAHQQQSTRHLRKRFRDHKFAHRPNPPCLLALGGFKASRPFGERNGSGVFFIFTRCLVSTRGFSLHQHWLILKLKVRLTFLSKLTSH
jgi:hypothetical protein